MNNSNILVVEDDIAIRRLITTALETEDYKYYVVVNGKQAVMEAATQYPELILLDLGLPDIDGIDVIKKIRSWSTVPITVISARSEDKDKIDALDAGADDYITKEIWGSSLEGDIASLRVHVATLRKKIEKKDRNNKCIQTHIGIGYCMVKQE